MRSESDSESNSHDCDNSDVGESPSGQPLMTKNEALYRPRPCPLPNHESLLDRVRPLPTLTEFMQHLNDQHDVYIEDSKSIAPFIFEYLSHYSPEIVYSASDKQPINLGLHGGDIELRNQLRRDHLTKLLYDQQKERQAGLVDYSRKCLFCKAVFTKRPDLFNHMFTGHSLNIGLLDNLIFVEEFLTMLEQRLSKLICIYCERTFKSAPVLRKHMRKKRHFKVNPNNPVYDRFYIVNYLNEPPQQSSLQQRNFHDNTNNGNSIYSLGQQFLASLHVGPHKFQPRFLQATTQGLSNHDFGSLDLNEDTLNEQNDEPEESWSDWQSESNDEEVTCCPVCDKECNSAHQVLGSHFKEKHSMDFLGQCRQLGYDFYDRVKTINYMRRCASQGRCYKCLVELKTETDKLEHFGPKSLCCELPGKSDAEFLTDTRYLLPTIDNDPLLRVLDDELEVQNTTFGEDCDISVGGPNEMPHR